MNLVRRVAGTLVLAASLDVSACDAPYEPPCRVTGSDDVPVGAVVRTSLVRARGRVLGTFVERAAALDADDARAVTGLTFATAASDVGGITLEPVALPPDLAVRKDGVSDLTVVRDDAAHTIVVWVTVAYDTDETGRGIASAALHVARPGARSITGIACTDCSLAVAVVPAPADGGFVAITRIASGASLGRSAATSLALHRIDGEGVFSGVTTGLPLARIAPTASDAAAALSAEDLARGDLHLEVGDEGRLLARSDGQRWAIDASLGTVDGPFALPSADAVVAERGGAELVAFSRSAFEDGRSGDRYAKRDVFLDVDGRLERASAGRLVLGLDASPDSAAVAFESAGATWLSVLDARGAKRGGDVLVRASASTTASELGVPRARVPTVVLTRGERGFVVVDVQGFAVRRTEVACGAP